MTEDASTSLRRSSRLASKPKIERPAPHRKSPKKKGQKIEDKESQRHAATLPSEAGMVYLRVNRKSLVGSSTTGLLNVIIAPLSDIKKFGASGYWLTRVACLILDPQGTGILYTFSTHTREYWVDKEKDDSWRAVQDDELLEPMVYEYCRLDQEPTVQPTKVSLRHARSITTNSSRNQSQAFRTALLARHPACVISGISYQGSLIAYHFIPRRLGDVAVQSIFRRFTGLSTPVTRYHENLGLTIDARLASLVDKFMLGFWHLGDDQYEIHVFEDAVQDLDINLRPVTNQSDRLFHRVITLESKSGLANPPHGVFDWHYIQGVLKKFATADYNGLPDIYYFDFPFRTRDDDDDDPEFDSPENIENPPYPSYLRDLAWSRTCLKLEEAERHQGIEGWRSVIRHV